MSAATPSYDASPKNLHAIGTVLLGTTAGCLSLAETPRNSSDGGPPSDGGPAATNETVDRPLTTDDIQFEAAVERQRTGRRPATVRLQYTNQSGSRATIAGGPVLPFSQIRTSDGPGHAHVFLVPEKRDWLTPTNERGEPIDVPLVPERPHGGCWTVGYDGLLRKQTMTVRELEPGETVAHEYTLLDGGNGPCFQAGTYVVADEVTVGRGGFSTEAPNYRARLGIAVDVAESGDVAVAAQEVTLSTHEHEG